ncbi:hypothetical protein, partial [Bosea sp. NPDC055594]
KTPKQQKTPQKQQLKTINKHPETTQQPLTTQKQTIKARKQCTGLGPSALPRPSHRRLRPNMSIASVCLVLPPPIISLRSTSQHWPIAIGASA